MMLKGKAHGGPRDGVTLEASDGWAGMVYLRVKTGDGDRGVKRHQGRYTWQDGSWIWETDRERLLE